MVRRGERLGQFIGMVEHDRLLGPDARLARSLAGLFNPLLYPNVGASLPISQEELGQLVGRSRQRINQALRLAQAGLLRIDYGGVTVLDLPGLVRSKDDASAGGPSRARSRGRCAAPAHRAAAPHRR